MTAIQLDPRTYGLLKTALVLLPQKVGLRVLRVALNAWGGIVKRVEQTKAKRVSGLLARSPRVKVTIPDASWNVNYHGRPPSVAVGPGRDVVGPVAIVGGKSRVLGVRRATRFVLGGGRVRTARPSRYAHFVEKGIAGKKHITPAPFVAPAVEAGKAAGFQKMQSKLTEGIAAEAAKLPKA